MTLFLGCVDSLGNKVDVKLIFTSERSPRDLKVCFLDIFVWWSFKVKLFVFFA